MQAYADLPSMDLHPESITAKPKPGALDLRSEMGVSNNKGP